MERRLWVSSYQKCIDMFSVYSKGRDKKNLDSALYLLNVAISVRPEKAELTRIKGSMYETIQDTIQIINNYNYYLSLIEKEIKIAKEKQFYVNMSRDELLKTIGKPEKSKGIRYAPMTDSIINDFFEIDGKQLIVTSIEKNKGLFNIDGWTYNPPSNWSENDITDLNIISIGPFAELAQIYFQRKEYKKSIEYALGLLSLDPNNVDANTFLIMVYKSQGGVDEALKSSAELVKTNPNNKFYRLQYGQMLFEAQKFNESIEQFEKAVQIDQNFASAVRNLAAAYKNKAVLLQREQQEAADKDPKYKKKPELYIPFLNKSADNFQKARKFKEYSKDFYILSELVNIYNVTEQKADCQKMLDELEKLEPEIILEEKYDYYLKLLKIYGDLKLSEKMNRAREEVEKYTPGQNK
ncbi:MAG: tetratricopeptide repeat protein [Ignavibacteriae bacterium]|nr:tetratricopeptide repeat protein [Ignavibacteriota bacterium]